MTFDYVQAIVSRLSQRHPHSYVSVHNPAERQDVLPRITLQVTGGPVGRFLQAPTITTRVSAATELECFNLAREVSRDFYEIRDEVPQISAVEANGFSLVSSTADETMYQLVHYLTIND